MYGADYAFIWFCGELFNFGAVASAAGLFALRRWNNRSDCSSRTKEFIYNVRYFRLFIGIWNLTVIVLMFTFFGG
ncbi:hypothetical protein TcWFU_008537 [Taenia crassiceps]|uniref:Uncharacterized protein n=1 Tax=Taenia crassiceps TaxID=6207 RepID=A0ABR4Q3J1_9CEST